MALNELWVRVLLVRWKNGKIFLSVFSLHVLATGLKMRKIEIGGQKEDKNQKIDLATLDFQEVTRSISAQNRTRTCTPRSTRT